MHKYGMWNMYNDGKYFQNILLKNPNEMEIIIIIYKNPNQT
jgi:hypothetical protein